MVFRIGRSALRNSILLVTTFVVTSICVSAIHITYRKLHTQRKHEEEALHIKVRDNTPAVIPVEFLENYPNISRHDYKYLSTPHRSEQCQSKEEAGAFKDASEEKIERVKRKRGLLILFMVHSKAEHFEYRRTIRETWGSVGKKFSQVVFLLGNPMNESLQRKVENENEEHGDIVQEDFYETYRNITLKNIMGLKWASQHCSHVKYVVKADDDMFINTRMLISTLISSRIPRKKLILCKIHFFKDVPREGKYIIDKSLYSENYWPSFCFGGCWIASSDVVRNLYDVSLQTKQIYLDDVYVTGILRTKLSLPINYLSRAYMIFCHTRGNYDLVREMWNALMASQAKEGKPGEKKLPYVDFWSLCFK